MKTKIISIFAVAIMIGCIFTVPVVPAASQEDQTQTEYNAGGWIGRPTGDYLVRYAQSVKASYSILSKVKLLLSGNDPAPKPTTPLIMEIRWDVYDSSTTQRSVSKDPDEIPTLYPLQLFVLTNLLNLKAIA